MRTVRRETTPTSAKPVIMALQASAAMFLALSICCFIFPEAISDFIGFNGKTEIQFFGGLLLAISLIEFFVLPSILIKAHKNTQNGN